ncbi:MAG TPA: chain-length determining protein, partial [Polyangiaceae bacterium]|nr:chain-length determining protein [Polyangiaceae bacterium]
RAAFNHRYQIVAPVELPTKPTKPKVAVILAAGIVLSLLFAFALPVLLEVRRDVLVERWQVHHFQLPVLAELKLPQSTKQG